ncbi:MAG: ferrous iron transport protein B [Dehalococcoidales bacterium]|nr:ferrous iron transport protein B [Dehalococcoidales bacterium]
MKHYHHETGLRNRARNRHAQPHGRHLTFALAGNANVGKSVIFNHLTGARQSIGNWPGKTVERATGTLRVDGYDITIVDLPGIYSLSTFSQEELVSREYIAHEKPDVVINIIGAPVLERNLFFTLQLLEMGIPVVVCLNQMDIAAKQGIEIDSARLAAMLGVEVVPAVATAGRGIQELIATAIKVGENFRRNIPGPPRYGEKLEGVIGELSALITSAGLTEEYPSRFLAIKLLEGDNAITGAISQRAPQVAEAARRLSQEIAAACDQPAFMVITAERYALASRIAREVQQKKAARPSLADRLDRIATHKVYGYIFSLLVLAGLLAWTFTVGAYLSELLAQAFSFLSPVEPQFTGSLWSIALNGLYGGFVAGVTLVVPYVIPFYLVLAVLEDSGILTRIAFMLDSAMHQIGLHGKAIIPIILGYGCNVPAIYGTRIMASRRERVLTALAITFAPCTARTIIILGMVATFAGIHWALALYALNLLIILGVGKIAARITPGELTGLIMEMHAFKVPSPRVIFNQTWAHTRSLIITVFPIYIIGSAAVQLAYALGWLEPVNRAMSFLTSGWLGLPLLAGTLLIFGAARKELILLRAVALAGSDLLTVFSREQLIVLALVGAIYPCFATAGVLTREFGGKTAWAIIGSNLAVALIIGGVFARIFGL